MRPQDRRTRRNAFHALTTLALVVVVGVAAVDGVGWWNVVGVDSATVRAEGQGFALAVRYPTISRPALASPFEIAVTPPANHTGPITVVIDRRYLALWDENGLSPAPAAETSRGDWVEWEFDAPAEPTLTVLFDARIEPGAQSGRGGEVGVVVDDEIVTSVTFHTTVRP